MTVEAHQPAAARRYRAYGQILNSNAPLPELAQVPVLSFPENADLRILFSSADEDIPMPSDWYRTVSFADGTPWLRCAKIDPGYLFAFQNLASFIFSPCDRSIRCIPHPQIPSRTLHHLLLDHVLPLVRNGQGKEVLHGSAVATPYGACAFVGPTGSGKSTFAASFLAAGYSVLADDCVLLELYGDAIVTIPAYPGLRLWDDALTALFGETGSSAPVAHYTPKQRFTAAVSSTPFHSAPIPLAGIYVLEPIGAEQATSASTLERPYLSEREALVTLLASAFTLDPGDHGMLTREFDFLHRLVARIPVRRLRIPDSFQTLPDMRTGVLHDLARRC